MLSVWVKGYKPEEKEKRKSEVLGYRNAFDDLKRILEQEYKRKDAVNEYNQVLDDIFKLITLSKE